MSFIKPWTGPNSTCWEVFRSFKERLLGYLPQNRSVKVTSINVDIAAWHIDGGIKFRAHIPRYQQVREMSLEPCFVRCYVYLVDTYRYVLSKKILKVRRPYNICMTNANTLCKHRAYCKLVYRHFYHGGKRWNLSTRGSLP